MTTTALNQHRQAATALVIWFLLSALIVISNSAYATAKELPDFETLVSNQRASVVNIQTRRSGIAPAQIENSNRTMPEFLRRFREFRGPQGQPPQGRRYGIGSGVIASADGYILTNAHVVGGATEIIVHLSDQREYPATLVGTDAYSDIAILKIEASELPAATFRNSDQLKVGQRGNVLLASCHFRPIP